MANAEIVARIIGDMSDLEEKLRTGEAKAKTFGSRIGDAFSGIGGKLASLFTVGAVTAVAKEAVAYASSMINAAAATQTNTDAYQALVAAGRDVGASQAQVDQALVRSTKAGFDAADGNKELAATFKRLGLDVAAYNALTPDKKLEALGAAYVAAGKSQQSFADIMDITGKATPRLLSVFNDLGNVGIQGLIDKFKEMGVIIGSDTLAANDRLGNSLQNTWQMVLAKVNQSIEGLQLFFKTLKEGSGTKATAELADPGRGDEALREEAIGRVIKRRMDLAELIRKEGGGRVFEEGRARRLEEQRVKESEVQLEITDILKERAAVQAKLDEDNKASLATSEKEEESQTRQKELAKNRAIIAEGQAEVARKELGAEEQITELRKEQAAEEAKAFNLTGEGGMSKEEVASRAASAQRVKAIEIEIAGIRKKDRDEQEKKDDKREELLKKAREAQGDVTKRRADLEEAGRLRPTIGDLAGGGVKGASEATTLARRFEDLGTRERRERARGNEEFADQLRDQRLGLGKRLEKFGIDKRESDPKAQFKEALATSEAKLGEVVTAIKEL